MSFHFKYRTHCSKQGKSISSIVRGKPKLRHCQDTRETYYRNPQTENVARIRGQSIPRGKSKLKPNYDTGILSRGKPLASGKRILASLLVNGADRTGVTPSLEGYSNKGLIKCGEILLVKALSRGKQNARTQCHWYENGNTQTRKVVFYAGAASIVYNLVA